jgi:nicotinamidase-related amidase
VDRNGLALLAAWRRLGWPVIHVRHDSIEPASTLRPGHPGHAFRPGFGPLGDERMVCKSANSAFIGTDLDLQLRRLNAQSIVAFGITTDMCVSTTIRMGSNMGWPMTLVEDACDCCALPARDGSTIPAETVQMVHVATLAAEFCKVETTAGLLRGLG